MESVIQMKFTFDEREVRYYGKRNKNKNNYILCDSIYSI